MSARRHVHPGGSARPRLIAIAAGLLILVGNVPPATVHAADKDPQAADGRVRPTVQYEEAMAHAADKIAFAPGGRVTVPFKPRKSDRWAVGGVAPRSLPAGRLSGKAIRRGATTPAIAPTGEPSAAVGAADIAYRDPAASFPVDLAAAVDPGGLKREVFGFLPYWELTDQSTRLDWSTL